jgi:carbamoyl-phosphate synthase small subunit
MEQNQTVGISDIDTRALVRHIRNKGAMNAIISSEILDVEQLKAKLKEVPSMDGLELSSRVTTQEAFEVCPDLPKLKVSLIDFGVKKNIVRCLVERGCHVKVFPMHATKAELDAFQPDGYMLSNGPGDPSASSVWYLSWASDFRFKSRAAHRKNVQRAPWHQPPYSQPKNRKG